MGSTMPWLNRQLKGDLTEMAEAAGMKDFWNLNKYDLSVEVDEFLRKNQPTLSNKRKLKYFYERLKSESPAASGKELVRTEAKTPKKRRTTVAPKSEEEDDSDEPASDTEKTASKTPARQSMAFVSQVPLPPSPAVVAERIDQQTRQYTTAVVSYYRSLGITEALESARDNLSTSASIATLSILLELFGLRTLLLPFKYLCTIPAYTSLGTPSYALKLPDLFVLLTSEFWSTVFLWSMTSIILPFTLAYFFNLTLNAKKTTRSNSHSQASHGSNQAVVGLQYDPLTFNIAKGLLAWLVYARQAPLFGWENYQVAINQSVPGRYQGVLIASGIGAFAALYEAVLRK